MARKKQPAVVDGVDVTNMRETIEQVRQHPEQAQLKLRAHNHWIDGAHGRTIIQDFSLAGQEDQHTRFTLEADEPPALLGTDTGPNATEAALHALASCLNTTFIYYAAAMGIEIEELDLELEGDIDLQGFLGVDPKVRNGYQEIRVQFHVKSDAPPEKIEQLTQLAQQHSPVFDVVTHAVPVQVSLQVE